jgi:glycosyltransferase involved in cell wall biosynthesis
MKKVVLVSSSDSAGGAAKAAFRFFSALKKHSANLDIKMVVSKKNNLDKDIITDSSFTFRLFSFLKYKVSRRFIALQKTPNQNYHSINFFPGRLKHLIEKQAPDIVNIHWVNDESISVEQIGKLQQNVVLTLHDMWAFCGAEHYVDESQSERYLKGYDNTLANPNKGLDINRQVWQRKVKAWGNKKLTIVTPSEWLTECAKQSHLFKNGSASFVTIANPLDIDIYKPLEKKAMRALLGIPENKIVIGFGALAAKQDSRKGFDLLELALEKLSAFTNEIKLADVVFLIFGANDKQNTIAGFDCYSTGHLSNEIAIVAAYNAMDVMLVPSRLEAFGQTASEAQACGVPIVCFNTSGLKDVVKQKETGYLAKAYDPQDFAKGITWVYQNRESLSIAARKHAIESWSYENISKQYEELYKIL